MDRYSEGKKLSSPSIGEDKYTPDIKRGWNFIYGETIAISGADELNSNIRLIAPWLEFSRKLRADMVKIAPSPRALHLTGAVLGTLSVLETLIIVASKKLSPTMQPRIAGRSYEKYATVGRVLSDPATEGRSESASLPGKEGKAMKKWSLEELLNLPDEKFGYEEYMAYFKLLGADPTKMEVGSVDEGDHIPLGLLDGCSRGIYDMKELDKYKTHLDECELCQKNYRIISEK